MDCDPCSVVANRRLDEGRHSLVDRLVITSLAAVYAKNITAGKQEQLAKQTLSQSEPSFAFVVPLFFNYLTCSSYTQILCLVSFF